MEKRFEIQDRDYEDEVEFTPKVRGVNEESISSDDPEIQMKEKVLKVSLNTNTKQCIIYNDCIIYVMDITESNKVITKV